MARRHRRTAASQSAHSHGLWQTVLVGALAALVVSAGFNYFATRTNSSLASPVFNRVFVDPQGNDNNPGTSFDKAFRTFDAAIAEINQISTKDIGQVTLYVNGNVYMTAPTVTLNRNNLLITSYTPTSGQPSVSQLVTSAAALVHATTFRISSSSNVQIKDVAFNNVVLNFNRTISDVVLDRVNMKLDPSINVESSMLNISGGVVAHSKNVAITNSSFASMANPGTMTTQNLVNIANTDAVQVKGNTFDGYHTVAYVAFAFQNCNGVTASNNKPSGTPGGNLYWKYNPVNCQNVVLADDASTVGKQ